ncbi:MAG: APC family permease [Synechococcus sp. ELA057]|jgi:APA family basic amino acid/polyamine antiporter
MSEPRGRLLNILGVAFGLAGAVGGTIGGGILRTPGLVAGELASGPLSLIAWLVGGLYGLLGAICVAELAASLPRSGGWTVYARRAFGDGAGFAVGWTDWLGHCAGVAWVAITAGDYTLALFPGLPLDSRALALLMVLLFTAIQLLGVRAGSGSQLLLSLAKTVGFLLLVGACFLLADPVREGAAAPSLAPPVGLEAAAAWVLALQAIISTYDGWHSPIYFAEEFAEPSKDLPRSLIGGVLAVIALYLLINLALLRVLPLADLAGSTLPLADAALRLFGAVGGQLITALALVSVLGLVNTSILSAPRVLYALARDGLFPSAAAQVSQGGTPTVALLLTSLTMALLVALADFPVLLAIASFLYVVLYGSGILALFVLRQREPELERPVRAWGHPWSGLIVLAGSLAFLIGALLGDRSHSLMALALMGAAVPLYLLSRRLGLQQQAAGS